MGTKLVVSSLILSIMFSQAPVIDIANCSKTQYRQTHLAQCNQVPNQRGGGGGGGGGILGGLLGGLLGGIGI